MSVVIASPRVAIGPEPVESVMEELQTKWSDTTTHKEEITKILRTKEIENQNVRLLLATPTVYYEQWHKPRSALICFDTEDSFVVVRCEQDSAFQVTVLEDSTFIDVLNCLVSKADANSKDFGLLPIPQYKKDVLQMKSRPLRFLRALSSTSLAYTREAVLGKDAALLNMHMAMYKWWSSTADASDLTYSQIKGKTMGRSADLGQLRASLKPPAQEGKTPNSLRFLLTKLPGKVGLNFTAFNTVSRFKDADGLIFVGFVISSYGDPLEPSFKLEPSQSGGYIVPILKKWMTDPKHLGSGAFGSGEPSLPDLENT
eukprot:802009_1